MNALHTAETRLDEEYWRAILSQGEAITEQPESETLELWEGFPHALTDAFPKDNAVLQNQHDSSNNRWALVQECLETGEIIELMVTGYNRGGLLVEWDGLRGFVPASHLSNLPYQDEERRRSELAQRVGTRLRLKVIELNPRDECLILSERMIDNEAQRRAELLTGILPGDVRQGCVTNLCPFGAFVDLGGIEGLIHISELSWGRVNHPQDVLNGGQLVDVYVLNVDSAAGKVGLSLKRLSPDPWETVEDHYQEGQLVEGIVTNVVNFGAFTRIEQGLEGLIHVSELAEGHFLHPRNVVREGEKVVARVLSIDSRRRRMALSLRQVCQGDLAEDEVEMDAWATRSMLAAIAS